MAIYQRKTTPEILVHSDRGTQFTSDAFQKHLADNKLIQWLNRKGNCCDNAAVKSFFGTLKHELVHRVTYKTQRATIQDIFQWFETWFNRH